MRKQKMTPLEDEMVAMLVSVLSVGMIVGVPRAVFTAGVAARAVDIADVVAALQDGPSYFAQLSNTEIVAEYIFVEVGKVSCKIVLTQASHVAPSKQARLLVLSATIGDQGSTIVERGGEVTQSDLAVWVRSAAACALLSLTSWTAKGVGLTVAPTRLAITSSSEFRQSALPVAPLALCDEPSLAIVPVEDYADASRTLSALFHAGASTNLPGQSFPNLLELDGVHIDTLATLSDQGYVNMHSGEFGEMDRWSLVESQAVIRSQLGLQFGCLLPRRCTHVDMEDASSVSKLELFALCIGSGWTIGSLAPELRRDTARVISAGTLFEAKAKLYVFVSLDKIFNVGVNAVFTAMPAKYLEYHMKLKDPSILNAAGESAKTWPHKVWVGLLAGRTYEEAARLPEAEPAAVCDTDSPQLALPDLEMPPQPELMVSLGGEPQWRPVVFTGLEEDGSDLEVYFDGCTLSCGRRAFVHCPKHKDENCRRYRPLTFFASVPAGVVSLAAWRLDRSTCTSKDEHIAHEPSQPFIDMVSAALPSEVHSRWP